MILVLFRRSLFLGPYTVHLFSNTNTWENNYNYDAAHDDDDDDDDAQMLTTMMLTMTMMCMQVVTHPLLRHWPLTL